MATTKVHTKKVCVCTTSEHINNGKCGDPRRCMERLAIMDALAAESIFPNKLRVDAGHVKAAWGGWRWIADTPRKPHNALIQWDNDLRRGKPISVQPHRYTLTFRRTTRVAKGPRITPERLAQIRAARKAREAATGTSDTKRYSRVIGHTFI